MALTSDHGEELFDHDGFEHGHTMFQELLRVPLLFWGPGVRPTRIETPGGWAEDVEDDRDYLRRNMLHLKTQFERLTIEGNTIYFASGGRGRGLENLQKKR